MPWIKKNLAFVICAGVAVVLLGVAVWFVLSNKGRDAAIQEELNQELSNWQGLNSGGAFPSQENIDAAKAESEKIKGFWKEVSKAIPARQAPEKMSDQAFAGYLGTTIAELRNSAASAGVMLPAQYDFTFATQRKSLNFPAGSIDNWYVQLNDIKSICNVLYHSRISALDGIQRVPVSEMDMGGSDLLQATVISNQFSVVMPYAVTFRGFTPELAAVVENLQKATNFIILKSVNVVQSTTPLGVEGAMMNYTPQPAYQTRRAPVPASSAIDPLLGGPVRPQPQLQPQPQRRVAAPAAVAETVISEQPLQVTLLLDVVKINPVQ